MIRRRLVIAALLLPATAEAQRRLGVEASAGVSTTTLVREVTVPRTFTGPVLGGAARLSYGRFELDGHYQQGTLTPEAGVGASPEDLAELAVHLNVRVAPWVNVGVGPRLRAFIAPSGTERWTRFEVRSRMEGTVIAGLVDAHAEFWVAASTETNVQGGGTAARGGNAGLTLHLPRSPIDLRLTYGADRASYASGGSEFLDEVSIAIAFRRP